MPEGIQKSRRLPRNFHMTFKPERRYISAMLRFAASGQAGSIQTIAEATGIPTGASTGKTPVILDYCRGMGLLRTTSPERSAIKKPELTPLGRIVFLEDPFLKEAVSQWIVHLNLCSPLTGADVWFRTFFEGTQALGMNFKRSQLESHLSIAYGIEKTGLIGPLIGMYQDDAAFHICGALSESSGRISRKQAPLGIEFGFGYGAWLLQQLDAHFPGAGQVSTTDLDSVAGWRTIPGWDCEAQKRALELVELKGLLEVDRHMEPWLLRPKVPPERAWKRLFDDLL